MIEKIELLALFFQDQYIEIQIKESLPANPEWPDFYLQIHNREYPYKHRYQYRDLRIRNSKSFLLIWSELYELRYNEYGKIF